MGLAPTLWSCGTCWRGKAPRDTLLLSAFPISRPCRSLRAIGKQSVVPLGITLKIDPLLLAFSILLMDLLAALFVHWNYELLKQIRFFGRVMTRVERKSNTIINKKWFGKLWWVGLTLFMIVPFQGTGSATTTVIGRILGVGPKVLIVVLMGSTISLILVTFASNTIVTRFFSP